MNKHFRKKLGEILLQEGLLRAERLEEALGIQRKTGERLGEVLANEGFVSQEDIIKVLELQLGISHVALGELEVDPEVCGFVPQNIARRFSLIPVKREEEVLTVAMSDPLNVFAIDDIEMLSGMEVHPVIAMSQDIYDAIDRCYDNLKRVEDVVVEEKDPKSLLRINGVEAAYGKQGELGTNPGAEFVVPLIEQAIAKRASDIHIEPFEKYIKIRIRVDGELYEFARFDISCMEVLVSYIKMASRGRGEEVGIVHEGRILAELEGKEFELTIHTAPVVFGEKIVIKVVNRQARIIPKDELLIHEEDRKKFDGMLQLSQGMILIAGPAGSGKTTTLYSMIHEMNRSNINITAIDEYPQRLIEGVNHVNIDPSQGLTFSTALKLVLNQDPNVIMAAKAEDEETLYELIKAVNRGCMVVTSFYARSTAQAVTKLMDMGMAPTWIASSVLGILSQRLLKRICSECKAERKAEEEELRILGVEKEQELSIFYGKGCEACNHTGYKGRIGIFEVMPITPKHQAVIKNGVSEEELFQASLESGIRTLRRNAMYYVRKGETTIQEVKKNIGF